MKTFQILANLIAAAFLAVCSISASAGTLSQLPLSLKSGVPPNIMFALSVEFPTAITPAYGKNSSNTADSSYSRNNSYLGYFDNTKCYNYNSSASNIAYAGSSTVVTGWFVPTAYSTTVSSTPKACVSGWSGNFLNWVSMAGLDEFRFAMTGGNRVVDLGNSSISGGLTVLQRSYQTSQGSNFITKTFTEDGYTTGYASGTALTIVNKGNGVNMVVTTSGTVAGTATCNTPTSSGSGISCASYTLSNGDTTTCSTYSGSGTSASPYQCTAFNISSAGTPITSPAATTSTSFVASGIASTVTLSCPANSFSALPPSCTATLTGGATGSCSSSSWTGVGSSGSPYACNGFGTFSGGQTFFTTSTSGSATATDTSSASYTNTSITCTVSGSTPTTTCSSLDGNSTTATCASYSNNGLTGSNKRYFCTSFSLSGSDTFVSASNPSTASTSVSGKSYDTNYTIVDTVTTPTTIYYTPTYTGVYGVPVYYYSTYNVSIGSGSTTYPVRVQVCNPSMLTGESDCTLYGDGVTYKPTGVLQNNGNTMRFGVTSYFNANDIDNAVLRAKAKYLAPQQYLSAGTFTPNAAAEWSTTDGTFVNNPDSADSASWGVAGTNSGVINYINKFGTVAQGYKTYDDIGKLYYETLKYLRGGNYSASTTSGTPTPTAAFYEGAKSSNNDGFPVITTWDDPVKYSCQKNYIITMGDVHTWCDKRLPGGTYSSSNTTVCNAYTDSNGNSHPADTGSLSGDTGITGTIIGPPTTTTYTVGGTADATNAVGQMEGLGNIATTQTGAGGASYYMAGLAAWAATNNIRPDRTTSTSPMNVKTFVIDVQEAGDCAYELNFWLTAKYGDPGNYSLSSAGLATWSGNNTWYNSILGNSISCSYDSPPYYNTSSSMSWPKNLLRAGDPVSMINSVNSAIQSIAAAQGDEASLAQSAGTLDTGTGAYIYQAGYNSGGWIGDLSAYVINQSGVTSTTPAWSASSMLPNPSARNVFSFNRSTKLGIQFALDSSNGLSNFDTHQQNCLNTLDSTGNCSTTTPTPDGFGADRVKYINGDMTNEAYLPSTSGATTPNTLANHGWRSRKAEGVSSSNTPASYTAGPTGQLGDIIDSNPLYVSAPASVSISDASYKTFATTYAARTPMVYVGGNDGMLHAFNASYTVDATTGLPVTTTTSGTELFAYVPYATFPTLSNLMSPSYVHTFYVDGSPVAADVCTNSSHTACSGTNDSWMTILVGGLNAGGKGIYALNITNPTQGFSTTASAPTYADGTPVVLWEFTGLDHPNLGNTFSQPIVAKLNNGRWAVIFGNGFNTGNTDVNDAFLFVLYVDPNLTGTPGWVEGTNFFRIALPSPGLAPISPCTSLGPCNSSNGLAGVAGIDVDHNGTIDYVYGGDRNGNMWKVDLTSSTPASWTASFSKTPLFSATDGATTPHPQQVTTTPKLANSPNGGYMVLFGTGSWIDTTDATPQSGSTFYTDTLYGIWDQHGSWDTTYPTSSPATGRSVLQRQALLGTYSIDSTGATCTSGTTGCTTYTIQSSCQPNFTTTQLNNVGSLCPQYVPVPSSTGVYTAGSAVLGSATLGSATTNQQFGWFFDLPGNGERSHSDPPSLSGSDVQFTTLTPSTNPCTGNTQGEIYNFTYATGEAPSDGIYILPGSSANAIAGLYSWTPIGGGTAINVVLSGQSLSGGAALNPITFNANTPASVTPPNGMPKTTPTACSNANNCQNSNNTTGAQTYIPGWGFLSNQGYGPSSNAAHGYVLSCVPAETGGGITCTWQHKTGQFGRLSWKQIN